MKRNSKVHIHRSKFRHGGCPCCERHFAKCDEKFKNVIKYEDILKFEGEYFSGERNGKGKEYYANGKLKFEGGYLNGERHGKGKEYDINGKFIEYKEDLLKFDGE